MQCSHFKIVFYPRRALAPDRDCNLNIWLGSQFYSGHLSTQHKVANVDWDQFDNVEILTFRSGPWEAELLSLLRREGNVLPFG